jgi:bifunctional UDP-N-acetylglucosamine pyrophosphorylase/glucosamine-1-phosphate N-acetyltransferase
MRAGRREGEKPMIGYVVLAAGKGTRMQSDLPKVVHKVLGKPLIHYVLDRLGATDADKIWTVVGHGADLVRKACADRKTIFVEQSRQLGTGHAVQLAWPAIVESSVEYVCVVNGDTPFVPVEEIVDLAQRCRQSGAAMGLLTLVLANPGGYGRVVRGEDRSVVGIIEEKDFHAKDHGGEVHEVNSGVYVFDVPRCSSLIGRLDQNNAQHEFYLTQMISLCAAQGHRVEAVAYDHSELLRGINSPQELVEFEEVLRTQILSKLASSGVVLRQPASIVIGPDVIIEPGVDITGPCEVYGKSKIERGAVIASHCVLTDALLGPCQVKSFSHIDSAEVREGAVVGPFARLRPGTVLESRARVGNFVEVKNSVLHSGAKAGHLTYLGDSEIGADTNIGAGTITCNYDGARKHKTEIGAGAFIGSNSALVAPVSIGSKALVAAGSVVTKDVPDEMLCVARSRQVNLVRRKTTSTS